MSNKTQTNLKEYFELVQLFGVLIVVPIYRIFFAKISFLFYNIISYLFVGIVIIISCVIAYIFVGRAAGGKLKYKTFFVTVMASIVLLLFSVISVEPNQANTSSPGGTATATIVKGTPSAVPTLTPSPTPTPTSTPSPTPTPSPILISSSAIYNLVSNQDIMRSNMISLDDMEEYTLNKNIYPIKYKVDEVDDSFIIINGRNSYLQTTNKSASDIKNEIKFEVFENKSYENIGYVYFVVSGGATCFGQHVSVAQIHIEGLYNNGSRFNEKVEFFSGYNLMSHTISKANDCDESGMMLEKIVDGRKEFYRGRHGYLFASNNPLYTTTGSAEIKLTIAKVTIPSKVTINRIYITDRNGDKPEQVTYLRLHGILLKPR